MDLDHYFKAINKTDTVKVIGKVIQVVGLVVEAKVQGVFIGEMCNIEIDEKTIVQGEVSTTALSGSTEADQFKDTM